MYARSYVLYNKKENMSVQDMFDIFVMCRSVLNSCFLDAGTLSRIVYTYESVVMYAIVLIG